MDSTFTQLKDWIRPVHVIIEHRGTLLGAHCDRAFLQHAGGLAMRVQDCMCTSSGPRPHRAAARY